MKLRDWRAAALLALVAALALGAVSCGDDEDEEGVSIPSISVPDTVPTTPETTPEPPATTAPESGGAGPQQPQDSPQNDVPPPKGSPQERFEEFCKQNPGACGN